MAEGLLIVLSGPSGVGKGTVGKILAAEKEDLFFSISMTTRSPRPGEIEGINYFFVGEEEFKKKIEQGDLLEWARVYDDYYGTPKEVVLNSLKRGQDVLLEIDTQGAGMIKSNFPDGVFLFLLPPSLNQLKLRIIGRGTETEEKLNKRFNSAYQEILEAKGYDYFVVNDFPERAAQEILHIIRAEKLKMKRNAHLIEILRGDGCIQCP
ncbi:guanylate kinase [Candidatus Contubernalis alkaliaceticus]|uniref:guanylate kinase n=1 Tax=Candidatus Contubernalis alkaliaceticus TaxID=338645 RepID=UPI001F4BDEF4|nr:guanylate kinase [Candidatus Contubernalis alkalaceticus]UNC92790.1 guanylate kinase [Candidatus Contubernalis alkalaceticus]